MKLEYVADGMNECCNNYILLADQTQVSLIQQAINKDALCLLSAPEKPSCMVNLFNLRIFNQIFYNFWEHFRAESRPFGMVKTFRSDNGQNSCHDFQDGWMDGWISTTQQCPGVLRMCQHTVRYRTTSKATIAT